jgi:hypothetical protein
MGRRCGRKVKIMKFDIRLSLMVVVLLAGCGSGNEPMSILGDPSQSLGGAVGSVGPGLALPINPTTGLYSSATQITPFSATNPYLGLTSSFYTIQVSILAPGTGTVVDISNQSVSIFHNAHIITKVTGIITSVQVGSYVIQGQVIGTALPSANYGNGVNPTLKFYVYADSIPVCPLTYLNSAGRTQLATAYSATSYTNDPCQ